MPKSTNLAKYPPGALDLIEQVCDTGFPMEVPYESTKKAKAGRFMFYGLIRALQINQHTLAEKASKLTFKLSGKDAKNPTILTIEFPTSSVEADFYAGVAAAHEAMIRSAGNAPGGALDTILGSSGGEKGKSD